MAQPTLLELFNNPDISYNKIFQKAEQDPGFWRALGKSEDEAQEMALNRKKIRAYEGAKEKAKESFEELAADRNKGLGKYSKLRQVVKSQKKTGGVVEVPGEELLTKNLKDQFGGIYNPDTRGIELNDSLSPQKRADVLRHERAHDFQKVGKQLKEPISSNWERLTWLESEGKPGVKSALGNVAKEIQARAVQSKSTPKALLNMAADALLYAKETENPVEKALYKGIGVFEQPARLTAKAINSGVPQKIVKVAKGLGSGLARGLAEAPAYEFVNPPSAGPSDPEDPVYQFERGLISEEEFLRRMSE